MSLLPRLRHVHSYLPGAEKSFALFSAADVVDVERAVVFVHGFSGSAHTTWADFLSLVDDDGTASRWWESADLYFFHYHWDSIFRQVSENAIALGNFLERIFPEPRREFFQAAEMTLRPDFRYKSLYLVGHSEGGLVIRHVILNAAKLDDRLEDFERDPTKQEPAPEGLLIAQLRLFAPAIAGEIVSGFLGILANTPVISSFIGASAAKKTLAETSSAVTTGRQYTDEYTKYLQMECFRAHILWADKDEIVAGHGYRKDIACANVPPKTGHADVCKPKKTYLLPIDFVERGVVKGKCGRS